MPLVQRHPSWNGKTAAVSLTFDDGDPSQSGVAIPVLDQAGFKGTFFMIGEKLKAYPAEEYALWKSAFSRGHEPAAHSMTHPHPSEKSPEELLAETLGSKRLLEELYPDSVPVRSYAYPYCEITPSLRKITDTHFIASRGGGRDDCCLTLDRTPDWTDIPSLATLTDYSLSVYKGWVDEAVRRGGWIVFQIHGLEGSPWGWQPIPRTIFEGIVGYLQSLKDEVWVAPFGEVSGFYRRFRQEADNSADS